MIILVHLAYLDGGQIKHLGIKNANITGRTYVGGLVGYNLSGVILSCYSTGNVTATATSSLGSAFAGGLVGLNYLLRHNFKLLFDRQYYRQFSLFLFFLCRRAGGV